MPNISDSSPNEESQFIVLTLFKWNPGFYSFQLSGSLPVLLWLFQTSDVSKLYLKRWLLLSWVSLSLSQREREWSCLLDSLPHLAVPPVNLIFSDTQWSFHGSKERERGDWRWPSGPQSLWSCQLVVTSPQLKPCFPVLKKGRVKGHSYTSVVQPLPHKGISFPVILRTAFSREGRRGSAQHTQEPKPLTFNPSCHHKSLNDPCYKSQAWFAHEKGDCFW